MELAPHWLAKAAYALEQHAYRLHRGKAPRPSGHSAQHAILGAGVAVLCIERIAHKTPVARAAHQVPCEGSDLSLEAANGSGKQGYTLGDASIGNGEAGCEIVRAIKHKVCSRYKVAHVFRCDAAVGDIYLQRIVKVCEPSPRAGCFAVAYIAGSEDGLTLEIARIHYIVIDKGKMPDPCTCEILQSWRANAAEPNYRNMLTGQRNLTRTADFGQHNVAGKTV